MPKLTYAGTFDQPRNLNLVRAEMKPKDYSGLADACKLAPQQCIGIDPATGPDTAVGVRVTWDGVKMMYEYLTQEQMYAAPTPNPVILNPEPQALRAGDLVMGIGHITNRLYPTKFLRFDGEYLIGRGWVDDSACSFNNPSNWRLPTPAELAEHAQEDGWREWDGGVCPVPCDTKLIVKFRDQSVSEDDIQRADYWIWRHTNDDDDIIAYRLVPQ